MSKAGQTNARGIYLVGFSGTGKSTVARILADKLGWRAYDLDDLIVERRGLSIPEIFRQEGEAGFRSCEADTLRFLSEKPPFVVATGGGTVVREENRSVMSRTGWVILLEAQPEVICARIQGHLDTSDPKAIRPLLDAADPLEKIRALKEGRQPAYDLADWTIHTDQLSPEQVAAEILRAVSNLDHSHPH